MDIEHRQHRYRLLQRQTSRLKENSSLHINHNRQKQGTHEPGDQRPQQGDGQLEQYASTPRLKRNLDPIIGEWKQF